jgi:hypothetical protein
MGLDGMGWDGMRMKITLQQGIERRLSFFRTTHLSDFVFVRSPPEGQDQRAFFVCV